MQEQKFFRGVEEHGFQALGGELLHEQDAGEGIAVGEDNGTEISGHGVGRISRTIRARPSFRGTI